MSLKRALAAFLLTYAATTIFVPKLAIPGMEQAGIYPLEPLWTALGLLLLAGNRLRLSGIERAYLGYVGFALASWMLGALWGSKPELKSLLLLVKFASFILLIPAAAYLRPELDERALRLVLASQLLFAAGWGGYVLFNTLAHPVSQAALIGGYSRDYRLVGLTGHVFSLQDGLVEIGHTSVQMGVHTGLLALVFASLFFDRRRTRDLAACLALVLATQLTYSRSGEAVLACGFLYAAAARSQARRWLVVISALAIPAALLLFYASDSGQSVLGLGTFAKFARMGVKDSTRLEYWRLGLRYLQDHPLALLLGAGYGTMAQSLGPDTLESLFLDTLFQSGIPALLCLLGTFALLWKATLPRRTAATRSYADSVLAGFHLGIPGLALACLVGGNSLQTDFIAPSFYLALGICLAHARRSGAEDAPRARPPARAAQEARR